MSKVIPPSFTIDHVALQPGLYLREVKKLNLFTKLKVWDLRFVAPSSKKFMSSATMHSIEHIMALKLREVLGDAYIGFYPMGCKTGFTFVSKSWVSEVDLKLALLEVIKHTIPVMCKSEIPCLTEKECGNPNLYNLKETSTCLRDYGEVLEGL